MRFFILTIFLCLGLQSLAFKAQAQGVTGSGGGGFGKVFKALFPVKNSSCEEGEIRNFFERDYTQNQMINVVRVCKNGSFYEKSNVDYKNLRCTDGTVGMQDSLEPNGGKIRKTFRCINGERVLIRAEKIDGR